MSEHLEHHKGKIINSYGRGVFITVKELIKSQQKLALAKNQLRFLEKCVDCRLAPKKFRKSRGAQESTMTRLCIARDKMKEKFLCCLYGAQELELKLSSELSSTDMRAIVSVIKLANEDIFLRTKEIYKGKFQQLVKEERRKMESVQLASSSERNHNSTKNVNDNNFTLIINEDGSAAVEPKFEPIIPKLPTADIISSLEPSAELSISMRDDRNKKDKPDRHKPPIEDTQIIGSDDNSITLADIWKCVMCETLDWVWKLLYRREVVSIVDVVGHYNHGLSVRDVNDQRQEKVKRNEWKELVSKLNDLTLLYSSIDSYAPQVDNITMECTTIYKIQ